MNKDIDLIIDQILIERGEHPSRVRSSMYEEERQLVKIAVEMLLFEPCSRHECHEHTESDSPMEGKKARKHNSPKLQEILDEVTPSEMEEKKAEMEGKTPLKGWISVEERLPEENQLVWGWDGEKSICLCCRIYLKNEGWFWGIADYPPYVEDGKIVADCIIEDIDVKYWQPLPELKLEE